MNRFFVYTRGRTGSSALVDDLNQHPQIVYHQELFFPVKVGKTLPDYDIYYLHWKDRTGLNSIAKYWDYLDLIASQRGGAINGMKILLNHLEVAKSDGIENVVWNTDIRVIYLIRDPVCHAISGHLANARKMFNVNRRYQKEQLELLKNMPLMRLDPTKINQEVGYAIYSYEVTINFLKTIKNPVFILSYEDYFGYRDAAYYQLADFLGVYRVQHPMENGFVKMTGPKWEKDIENIDEILDYLKKNGRDLKVALQNV